MLTSYDLQVLSRQYGYEVVLLRSVRGVISVACRGKPATPGFSETSLIRYNAERQRRLAPETNVNRFNSMPNNVQLTVDNHFVATSSFCSW